MSNCQYPLGFIDLSDESFQPPWMMEAAIYGEPFLETSFSDLCGGELVEEMQAVFQDLAKKIFTPSLVKRIFLTYPAKKLLIISAGFRIITRTMPVAFINGSVDKIFDRYCQFFDLSLDNDIEVTEKLVKTLRFARQLSQLTLKELAAEVGISRSYLSKIERGKGLEVNGNEAGQETIKKIMKALRVYVNLVRKSNGHT